MSADGHSARGPICGRVARQGRAPGRSTRSAAHPLGAPPRRRRRRALERGRLWAPRSAGSSIGGDFSPGARRLPGRPKLARERPWGLRLRRATGGARGPLSGGPISAAGPTDNRSWPHFHSHATICPAGACRRRPLTVSLAPLASQFAWLSALRRRRRPPGCGRAIFNFEPAPVGRIHFVAHAGGARCSFVGRRKLASSGSRRSPKFVWLAPARLGPRSDFPTGSVALHSDPFRSSRLALAPVASAGPRAAPAPAPDRRTDGRTLVAIILGPESRGGRDKGKVASGGAIWRACAGVGPESPEEEEKKWAPDSLGPTLATESPTGSPLGRRQQQQQQRGPGRRGLGGSLGDAGGSWPAAGRTKATKATPLGAPRPVGAPRREGQFSSYRRR